MKSCGFIFCADRPGYVDDRRAEASGGGRRRGLRGFCAVLVLLFCGASALPARPWERTDVLEAIHQVENPGNSTRVGRYGELGPFQFRPAVWRTYTRKPFELATDHAEALAVAEMHYDWIASGLARNGYAVSPYHVALAWNAGLKATVNGRASSRSRHYAQRVANLVEHAALPADGVATR